MAATDKAAAAAAARRAAEEGRCHVLADCDRLPDLVANAVQEVDQALRTTLNGPRLSLAEIASVMPTFDGADGSRRVAVVQQDVAWERMPAQIASEVEALAAALLRAGARLRTGVPAAGSDRDGPEADARAMAMAEARQLHARLAAEPAWAAPTALAEVVEILGAHVLADARAELRQHSAWYADLASDRASMAVALDALEHPGEACGLPLLAWLAVAAVVEVRIVLVVPHARALGVPPAVHWPSGGTAVDVSAAARRQPAPGAPVVAFALFLGIWAYAVVGDLARAATPLMRRRPLTDAPGRRPPRRAAPASEDGHIDDDVLAEQEDRPARRQPPPEDEYDATDESTGGLSLADHAARR